MAEVAKSSVVKGGSPRLQVALTDGRSTLSVSFFGSPKKPFLVDYWHSQLHEGARGIFIGRVGIFNGYLQLTHPDYVVLDGADIVGGKGRTEKAQLRAQSREAMARAVQRSTMVGLYPSHGKLPTWVIAESVQMALPTLTGDTLPAWVVEAAGVLPFQEALTAVHEPTELRHAEVGKERLKFDESFGIQLAMAHRRRVSRAEPATPRPRRVGGLLDAFDERLPFTLTKGQTDIGETIFDELARTSPMHRLLRASRLRQDSRGAACHARHRRRWWPSSPAGADRGAGQAALPHHHATPRRPG